MDHRHIRFASAPPAGVDKISALSAIKVALGSIGFLWVALILSLLR